MTVSLLIGDALTVLRTLPAGSVQCCVTSPPYYALRAYLPDGHPDKALEIGSEATPEQFIARLVGVFAEVRRVLRDDGTLWINIGDSYASTPPGNKTVGVSAKSGLNGVNSASGKYRETLAAGHQTKRDTSRLEGIKAKDLLGIPWMLAFALRADGWYLRSEIIWAKRNCMPESVKDRPTRAHEQVFLLTKRANYFYDAVAIEEDGDIPAGTRAAKGSGSRGTEKHVNGRPPEYWEYTGRRNKRTVWTMATKPFPQAHFATFPPELPETCIKAGTSERGCCPACGAPWERVVEHAPGWDGSRYGARAVEASGGAKTGGTARSTLGSTNGKMVGQKKTVGFEPSCKCTVEIECPDCEGGGLGSTVYAPNAPGGVVEQCCERCQGRGVVRVPCESVPCTVLDPFAGAGTTGLVADRLGRDAVLIDLSGAYGQMQEDRLTADAPLLTTVTRRPAPNQQDALI